MNDIRKSGTHFPQNNIIESDFVKQGVNQESVCTIDRGNNDNIRKREINNQIISSLESAAGKNTKVSPKDDPEIRKRIEDVLRNEVIPKIVDAIFDFLKTKVNEMKNLVAQSLDQITAVCQGLKLTNDLKNSILRGIEEFSKNAAQRCKSTLLSQYMKKVGKITSIILHANDVLRDGKITIGELFRTAVSIGTKKLGAIFGAKIGREAGLHIGFIVGGIFGGVIGGIVGTTLGNFVGSLLGSEFGNWIGGKISKYFGMENKVVVDLR